MLGAISGRSIYEALWGSLSKAGVKLPGFWDGPARSRRAREDREGMRRFAASAWMKRNQRLFDVAAEVQELLE